MNPYNCTSPGNLFTGYAAEIRQVTTGFQNGKSFTVLGGHRCGKTSFLLQVKDQVTPASVPGRQAFARLIDLGGEVPHSAFEFFGTIYSHLVSECDAPAWDPAPVQQPYREFLSRVRRAAPAIENRHGEDWLAILLIDKLDLAKGEDVFNNLRNLLQLDDLKRRFRLVGTGGSAMYNLVTEGSPLVNILEPVWLRRLSEAEADEMIAAGPPQWRDLRTQLFELSGRHPYILQGLLERLWDSPKDLEGVARRFGTRLGLVFQHWKRVLGQERCAVYRVIAESDAGMTEKEIRKRSGVKDIDEPLRVLAFHGVIDDSDRPRIAGTLFRDWFRRTDGEAAPKRFTVAFSFAGETRNRVEPIATLIAKYITEERVLYDKFHEAEFARIDLDTHLQKLYHDESDLIVVVICAESERKMWPGLEWRAIRDLINHREGDIMLLRTDDGTLPGVFAGDGYIDLRQRTDEQAADLIFKRLRQR